MSNKSITILWYIGFFPEETDNVIMESDATTTNLHQNTNRHIKTHKEVKTVNGICTHEGNERWLMG